MDVNVVSLPTTIPWAAISTVAAVVVTLFFTYLFNAQRLKGEWATDLRKERIKAYANMARVTKQMSVPDPEDLTDLAEAHSEMEILTEDFRVLEAANLLLKAAAEARQASFEKDELHGSPFSKDRRDAQARLRFEETKETLDCRRNEFIDLARKELGQGPKPRLEGPSRREEDKQGQSNSGPE